MPVTSDKSIKTTPAVEDSGVIYGPIADQLTE